ncbi:MAG TPA: hypothetical protein VFI48_16420, partial [Hyphomicrobiaceae bacterium]|nr:hypothetical protein [Hyphomicrobiaceae bacterium]
MMIGFALKYGKTEHQASCMAYARFKTKFGHLPHGYQQKSLYPSADVLGWWKHENIRYAKSRYNPANAGARP